MQQSRGMSTSSARPIAQPLTDLHQNVLSGSPRLQLNRRTAKIAVKPVIVPNEPSQATAIQKRLKAIGLSQYADAFAKEEIDEEVLPCLTVQDLQSLGVCNRAHQRLILSAALQPATQQVARPPSRPHAAAPTHISGTHAQLIQPMSTHISATHTPSLHTLSTHTSCKQDRGMSRPGSCSTDAVLPNKALPRGGLQRIATAVAANLTKGPAATGPSSSRSATAQHAGNGQQQLRPSCTSLPAGTTVAGAAAPATCLCPPRACTTGKGTAVPVRGALAKATGTLSAAKAVAKEVAVIVTNNSAATGAIAGTARHVVTTSASLTATAKVSGAADKADATAGKTATTAGKTATTADKAALLPAPQIKAEEGCQLAMALSASMSAGNAPCALGQGLLDPSQGAPVISQPASEAASQGVFSTMMAASKHKSKSAAPTVSGIPPSGDDTCCSRSQEESLLARIFATQASSSAVAVVLSSPRAQGLTAGCSPAQPVSPSRSLWACAGRDDPPGCQLQSRVQKRKAEAVMQAEVAKQQQRAEQLRLQRCKAPDVSLASSQSEPHHTALCEPSLVASDDVGSISNSGGSAEAADCIDLASPHDYAHGKSSGGRCLSSQPSQCVSQRACAQTMDPVKRMRLQALQQELKAARQTVADLERMIKAEEVA